MDSLVRQFTRTVCQIANMDSLVRWLTWTVLSGSLHGQSCQIPYIHHFSDGLYCQSCQVAYKDSLVS